MASPRRQGQALISTPRRRQRATTPDMRQTSQRCASHLRKGAVCLAGSPLKSQSLSQSSTPSTTLGSNRSASSGSLHSVDCAGASSLAMSVRLATGHADQIYIDEAERILSGDIQALEAMRRDPDFLDAMMRQGIDISDLNSDSRISRKRCIVVLGAALQDKAMYEKSLGSRLPCSASVYEHQVHRNFEESLQRVQRNWARHHQVAQNQAQLALKSRTRSKERALSEQARTDRLKARESTALAARKQASSRQKEAWSSRVEQGSARLLERVSSCEAMVTAQDDRFQRLLQAKEVADEEGRARSQDNTRRWQERVEEGANRLASHVGERQAFLQEQDERFAKHQQHLQKQEDEARGRLRSRFVLVQHGVESAHTQSEATAKRLHQSLERRLRRSDQHQEALRQETEKEQQIQEQKRQDREHQRDRVARVKDYQRSIKAEAIAHDREVFGDARRLDELMHLELMRKRG